MFSDEKFKSKFEKSHRLFLKIAFNGSLAAIFALIVYPTRLKINTQREKIFVSKELK